MASLLQCLLRACFKETPEESPDNPDDPYEQPQPNRISRLLQSADTAASAYSVARIDDPVENDEESGENCHNVTSEDTCDTNRMTEGNPHVVGLRQFWRNIKERFSLEDADTSCASSQLSKPNTSVEESERIPILEQASSFDASKEVPTIQTEQIVLPGSDLQRQMAEVMAAKLEKVDDECVICMEGFDPTNPRMPTLCGCGENKTYFHLPCLYQWIEQSRNCPSCRKRLRWEEF